jgi:hypothetical protein
MSLFSGNSSEEVLTDGPKLFSCEFELRIFNLRPFVFFANAGFKMKDGYVERSFSH